MSARSKRRPACPPSHLQAEAGIQPTLDLHTGAVPLEDNPEDFARQTVTGAAQKILADVREVPRNLLRLCSGEQRETTAGQLTVTDPALGPAFALTLLLFRSHIFKEIRSPEEKWWQAG